MRGKMHHGIGPAQRLRQFRRISDIADNEFESFGEFPMAGAQIVVDDDFVASPLQNMRRVTANVSSSPDHQNGQVSS
jgi:hypothetical protein